MALITTLHTLAARLTPRPLFLFAYGFTACFKNCHSLLIKYGLLKSSFRWASVNRCGNPIPWFTYPANEYLDNLDLAGKRIFEYGSGNSTLYFSARTGEMIAAEDDAAWKEKVAGKLLGKATLIFAPDKQAYAGSIATAGGKFDVIIIDGSHRLECAQAAIPCLKTGGFVILDDSDDYTEVAETLRKADLIQIDFHGFNPINSYTKTTSFFLHSAFRPRYTGSQAPEHSIAHHARRK